jgi:glutamate/tyrosine decarboxylase-like PLP-dependent enzyme
LKVWLALRQVGRSGYVKMIGDDMSLSRRLFECVAAHPELEEITQGLSITTFRYVPTDLRPGVGSAETEQQLNELNEALIERIQSSGELFLSNAVVRGRYVLRACIVNFNTTAADIDSIPEIVARMGSEVRAALRTPQAV